MKLQFPNTLPYKTITHTFTLKILLGLCLTLSLPSCSQASLKQAEQQTTETSQPSLGLPKESRVPGGIALITFETTGTKDAQKPSAYFNNQRVMVLEQENNQWVAVVGLSLKLKPGEHSIEIHHADGSKQKKSFEVGQKDYEAQYITLQNKEQVSPSAETLKRIRKESRTMREAFAAWNDIELTQTRMPYPVEGPLSSQFGLKRFFNKQPRNPHSGLDIAAPTGSPIANPLQGKVTAVGNYYFNGNTVLIDHGQGLISMYCHLDETQVELGQVLEAGEIIGTVGATGRATGPHLHWSVNLNNTRVDPSLFLHKTQQESSKQKQP